MNLTETALTYHRSGLTPLPAIRDEKRPRLSKWKQYQTLRPSEHHMEVWFEDADALCVLTGTASGNLELIDFDFGAELFNAWCERVTTENPDLLNRLVIETTQSGGMHVVYRCADPVCGNLKLAQREIVCDDPDEITVAGKQCKPRRRASAGVSGDGYHVVITLIETRGEGGLFLCDPTPGYEIVQGDMSALPVLSADERELLLMTAWSLNEYVPPPITAPLPSGDTFGLRPGDDYNQRGDVRSVLQAHGWQPVSSGDSELWRRPGKAKGWSASLKDGAFYIFSTNAAPFESGRAYSPFAVYAMLNHNGDFDVAARELGKQGYGDAPTEDPDVDLSAFNTDAAVTEQPEIDIVTLASVLPGVLDDLANGEPPVKYECGLPVDLRPGRFLLIGGAPGSGKTAFALQTTIDALKESPNLLAVFCNVEMDLASLTHRILARYSGVPLTAFSEKAMDAEMMTRVRLASETLNDVSSRMALSNHNHLHEIETIADRFFQENVERMLVLDYAQRIDAGAISEPRKNMGLLTERLRKRALAGECVVCLSATSRQKDLATGRSSYDGLSMASFKESGDLEYAADQAALLSPGQADGERVLNICKHRYGAVGSFALQFDGSAQRFNI